MAAASAVTPVGPAEFFVLLMTERHAAVAAIACGNVDEGFVNELHELIPSLQIRKPRQAGLRVQIEVTGR
jgi:hypothetical protein